MAVERGRRWFAAVVAAVTIVVHSGLPASAEGVALFRGRVLAADGATPRAGVTVALVEENGSVVRSRPSDDRGAFGFDSVVPGAYTVIAEGPEGAFVASGKVRLREGENPAVALALRPAVQEPDEQQGSDSGQGEGEEQDPATPQEEGEQPQQPPPPAAAEKEGLSPLVKGLIAGAVGLLAVAVILEIDDSEEPGSPF